MTPETVVQNQLNAYNDRDINVFLACHSENFEAYGFSEQKPYLKGKQQLQKTYSEIFENSPNLYSKLINRIVFSNKVIDHEEITGRKGVDVLELVAIYEVEGNVITKAHFMRK